MYRRRSPGEPYTMSRSCALNMTALISPTNSDARRGMPLTRTYFWTWRLFSASSPCDSVSCVLEIDLDPNWAVFALNDRGDLREELYAHGLAAD